MKSAFRKVYEKNKILTYRTINNKLYKVENFTDLGLRHGKFIIYYSNGLEAAVCNYVNGNLHGKQYYFHRNGDLYGIWTYGKK